jgi:hypothetical protein
MGVKRLQDAVTAVALVAATVGLVGCSSSGHVAATKARGQVQATRTDMVACASVDAVYGLVSRHETVPTKIAQRVISSSESAENGRLQIEARTLQADVEKADGVGVENDMSALGATCNSLGVGPAKY